MDDDSDGSVEANPKYSFRPSEVDPETAIFATKNSKASIRPGSTQTFRGVQSVASSASTDTDLYVNSKDGRNNGDDDDDDDETKSLTVTASGRNELWAPAGKLGVAIDVVNGQPVVHRVRDGSPLEGFLQKGDKVVAIDEVDTSYMSAADVTALMVRRMTKRRKIVYVRGDP